MSPDTYGEAIDGETVTVHTTVAPDSEEAEKLKGLLFDGGADDVIIPDSARIEPEADYLAEELEQTVTVGTTSEDDGADEEPEAISCIRTELYRAGPMTTGTLEMGLRHVHDVELTQSELRNYIDEYVNVSDKDNGRVSAGRINVRVRPAQTCEHSDLRGRAENEPDEESESDRTDRDGVAGKLADAYGNT